MYADRALEILKQIHKSENFSQTCHLNWQNQYHLYTVHHFIHPNMHYVTVDERTSLITAFKVVCVILISAAEKFLS